MTPPLHLVPQSSLEARFRLPRSKKHRRMFIGRGSSSQEDSEHEAVPDLLLNYDTEPQVSTSGPCHISPSFQAAEDVAFTQDEFLQQEVVTDLPAGYRYDTPLEEAHLLEDVASTFLDLPSSQATVISGGDPTQDAYFHSDYSGLRDKDVVSTTTSLEYADSSLCSGDPLLPNEFESDFILFGDAGLPDLSLWPAVSEPSPSLNSWTTSTSPCSFALSEEALGSPQLPFHGSAVSNAAGRRRKSAEGGDVNLLAQRRILQNDEGLSRRKPSAAIGTKRKRPQNDEPSGGESPEDQPPKTKRPRKPKYFCPVEACGENFTRLRPFELHMGNVHGTPLYVCEVCGSIGTRGDNVKNHPESQKHLKNLRKAEEAAAAAAAAAASATYSPDLGAIGADIEPSSVSSSTFPPCPDDIDGALSAPVSMALAPPFVVVNQHSFADFIPLIKKERIIRLQATIEVLQFELAELVKPEEDLYLQQDP
ncbi:hypothetical protein Dda_8280 [Drechslerella dactyloides]|uniref:C2H2-type domain-containing protein n=1 Tax=Drechslerella dactyloides TaxID=74499 RepID=A0AAD6IS48_DREDA|nr:hypothetical protein Dda_8280 [Drechslerella dactyloides]